MVHRPSALPPCSDNEPVGMLGSYGSRQPAGDHPERLGGIFSKRESGFTLTEVVVALAIVALTFGVAIYGYLRTTDRAEWSAYSLAAQSLAMQGVEQARAAKWDPRAWPVVDELGVTNFTQVEELDVPVAGEPVLATNYISVSTVSVDPPLRQLRADCIWMLRGRPTAIAGPFTNTAVTLRAADQ